MAAVSVAIPVANDSGVDSGEADAMQRRLFDAAPVDLKRCRAKVVEGQAVQPVALPGGKTLGVQGFDPITVAPTGLGFGAIAHHPAVRMRQGAIGTVASFGFQTVRNHAQAQVVVFVAPAPVIVAEAVQGLEMRA